MKKSLLLGICALAISAFMTGCAGIAAQNGYANVPYAGLFSDLSGNTMIQATNSTDYKVIKRNVTATAQVQSFFGIISLGDASFATMKAAALAAAPGADDIIDVKVDYSGKCIIGINTVTVKMTGTAIKWN